MRKSLLLLLSIMPAMLIVGGCTRLTSGNVEYIAAHSADSDDWILIDNEGNTVGGRFSKTPSMVINGFYTTATDEGIEIRRAGTSTPFASSFGPLHSAGVMSDDRIPIVQPNGRIRLLNADGDSIATLMPVDGNEIDAVAPFFSSKRMIVHVADGSKNGLYGAITPEGTIAVDPVYDMLFPFHGDYALAAQDSIVETGTKKKKKKQTATHYSLIDRNGKTIVTLPEGMTPLTDGVYREVIPVTDADDQLGFFNIQGQFLPAPDDVDRIASATDRCFVYITKKNMRGVMSIDGDSILQPIFTQIYILDDDHFIVNNDEMECPLLVDRNMEPIIEFSGAVEMVDLPYHFPFIFDVKFIGRTADDTYIIYNDSGDQLSTETIDNISTQMILNPRPGIFSDMVASDYFDLYGAAELISGPISKNGYGDASLSKTIKGLTKSAPEKLTSTKSIQYITSKGHRYSLTATAYTAAAITTAIPVYKEKSDDIWSMFEPDEILRTDYEYNPKATVNKIVVKLTTETPIFSETRKMIERRIENAGFKATQTTDAFTVYNHGEKCYLVLIPLPEQKGTAIYMMTNKTYDSSIATLRREAEINFAQK